MIARDDLERDALSQEVRKDLAGVGPDRVLEHDQRERLAVAGQGLAEQLPGTGEEQHASPLPGKLLCTLAHGSVLAPQKHVGRPDEVRASAVERGSRPLSCAREGLSLGDRPTRRRDEGRPDRLHRCVRTGIRRRERAEHLGDVRAGCALEELDVGERDLPARDRSRLVEAEHVHAGEQLDRRELLGQGALARQRKGARDERDAREQDEPVRHHGDRCCHRALNGLLPGVLGPKERDEEQRRCRRDQEREPAQNPVDARSEVGVDERETLRLFGQLARVAIRANARGPVEAAAGRYEAARHHLVARVLVDRIRLAGEQRLIELEPLGGQYVTINDHLVSWREHEHIVLDDLVNVELGPHAVAHGVRAGAFNTARRLSSRRARSSWTIPIRLLATTTPTKRPSRQKPEIMISTKRVTMIPLTGVITFARTISATERTGAAGTVFVRPSATRWATSLAVSPRGSEDARTLTGSLGE